MITFWVCKRWRYIFETYLQGHGKQAKVCLGSFDITPEQTPLMKFLMDRGCPHRGVYTRAVDHKRLDILRWLIHLKSLTEPLRPCVINRFLIAGDTESCYYLLNRDCPIDWRTVEEVAKLGDLELLERFRKSAKPISYVPHRMAKPISDVPHRMVKIAAKAGHKEFMLRCRDWYLEFDQPEYKLRMLDTLMVSYVAAGGHFELLKWCLNEGFPNLKACDGAVMADRLDILEWLRDPSTGTGIAPWSTLTCATAARRGDRSRHLLTWLRDPDTGGGVCPWDASIFSAMVTKLDISVLEDLRDPDTLSGVCPWDQRACGTAAMKSQSAPLTKVIEVLSWLRNPDTGGGVCPWTAKVCNNAAKVDDPTLLEWLRNPDTGEACPWDEDVCNNAALRGHLTTLKWLRDPNTGGGVCPWDRQTILDILNPLAKRSKVKKLLQWVRTQPD